MTGDLMRAEIAEQPESLERLLRSAGITGPGGPAVGDGTASDGTAGVAGVATRVREAAPRFVLLAARGTSDHAALYAKYVVETTLGLPCGLVSTSVYTTYDARPDLTGVLWIAVSQSGGSPDLVESTRRARAAGALTVALTNTEASPLAAAAELHVDLLAGPERSVAATKTYTSSLLALWLLVRSWAGLGLEAARDLPRQVAEALTVDVGEVASRYRFVDKLVTTSRGYAYPTAREAALKLMETCYLSAHAYSGADLLHGPLAMVDQDRPVLAVVPDGPGGRALEPVLEALQERGADVCLVAPPSVADRVGSLTPGAASIALPEGLDEQLAPIVQIVPLQRLACAMAVGRGLDPDQPRGLLKVTKTT
ncbi:SIS domain-containing protein [Terracoccus luteus]|uniref:Glucosamine--fructose-6-phosphate aminotransferase (Isomerizing) n=1 Tax=Terracoccus luteus TaxID=53356 RepID=A0A839Q246_9MICO|nr:SIS domain-containing protein [Terracoccus luteus]MBB2988336.1 glucosamine--fructose-6-phosphate aminotransferase (isomerizing) [Terracoccus luteus]MCP2173971.1 glucosamine--fructose-6-phosphate aminotransferase (isomerizing) [Terracoccus luteus]